MSAAERLAALDDLSATELCTRADDALQALVVIMNEETTLLRTGHYREAAQLTGNKTQLAQDYVAFARSVQRHLDRLGLEAPDALARLQRGHERLATQMAENLRVIATARDVTEDLLSDVATAVNMQAQTRTYGATGVMKPPSSPSAGGLAVNRAL